MRPGLSKILITGGAGFIGSEFVRLLSRDCPRRGLSLTIVDNLTYAGDIARLQETKGIYKFYKTDIRDKAKISALFKRLRPEAVVHFAAETHVDRSIQSSSPFVDTNVSGTQVLLDASRAFCVKRFIHVSTDEVYGDILKGKFSESSFLSPSSPYSASKAGADLLVKSYVRTFGFPAIIVRPSNNYGPWQYPEKFIPVAIYKAMHNDHIPLYGNGRQVREWLYVSDCVDGIWQLLRKGKIGSVYNLGSGHERTNIEVAKKILSLLGKPQSLIGFVKDRAGHDIRYSLNSEKIRKELNWRPKVDFNKGLLRTVEWYKNNPGWFESKVKYLKSYWKKVYR